MASTTSFMYTMVVVRSDESRDLRAALLCGLDELFARSINADVDHVITGPLEHIADYVLADVVEVSEHRAHHDRAFRLQPSRAGESV